MAARADPGLLFRRNVHAPGIVPVRAAPIDREHHGRALIIEDSPELTMLIAELLRSLGYGLLHIASSEIGAIQAASAYLPDLIVGDDRIRQGSSIAAVRMICWEIPVPTVFLVADPAAFQPLSPHAVLVEQPFGKRTLRDAIDRSATLAAQLIGPLS